MDKRLTCSTCGSLALGIVCEHLAPLLAREYRKFDTHPVHEFHGVDGLLVTTRGLIYSAPATVGHLRAP